MIKKCLDIVADTATKKDDNGSDDYKIHSQIDFINDLIRKINSPLILDVKMYYTYNHEKWLGDNKVKVAQKQYLNGLRKIEEDFNVDINRQFDQDECKELFERIKNNADQALVNMKNNGGIKPNAANYESYLKKYIEFKKSFSGQLTKICKRS